MSNHLTCKTHGKRVMITKGRFGAMTFHRNGDRSWCTADEVTIGDKTYTPDQVLHQDHKKLSFRS